MTWHQNLHAGNSALARNLFDEAEYQFKSAIAKARQLSVVDPEVTEAMRNLSRIVLDRGRAEEALSLAKEATEIDQNYWLGPSEQVCKDLLLTGDALDLLKRSREAADAYLAAVEMHEQLFGVHHAETMKVLARFLVLQIECAPDQVDRAAMRVLAFYSRTYPAGTLCGALGLERRLKLLMENNRSGEADQYFKGATIMLRKHLGDHNAEVTALQRSYASMLSNSNKQLSAWRLKSTAENQTRKEDLLSRAEDLMLHGKYEEAEPLIRQHLSSLQIQHGPSHPLTVAVRKKYAAVLQRLPAGAVSSRSLRERVLDVVTRMAITGSQWKSECEDAMQIHRIGPAEVEEQVNRWHAGTGGHGPSSPQPAAMEHFFVRERNLTGPQPVRTSGTNWPAPQDYNEAVQTPGLAFSDQELKAGTVELNAMGLPIVATGAFAAVYKFFCGDNLKAVRFFLSPVRDREYRYQQLSDYICSDDLIYTVNFEYQQSGIRMGQSQVPLLKMEWVEGTPLHLFIENYLLQNGAMDQLRQRFRRMTAALKAAGVAHGDLQHGNILVRDEELVLVDYDGMFVPALAGHSSPELGHPNYQHPGRNESHFGPYMDNFSAWVIDVSVSCLSIDPTLWYTLNGGDEHLLFHRNDFLEPGQSRVVKTLLTHPSSEIRQRTEFLLSQINRAIQSIPSLGEDGSAVYN